MISVQCPVCRQMTRLQAESLTVGMEVSCRECLAILVVRQVSPPILAEFAWEDED